MPDVPSCLSIVIARLEGDHTGYMGGEIPSPETEQYTDYVELNTVGKLKIERVPVYDEGETRVIYIDYNIELDAVIHASMSLGEYIDGTGPLPSFNDRIEKLERFLTNQGLAINYVHPPRS